MLCLQERQALSCLAAFLTLSPFAFRNLSTQAVLQNFSCKTKTKQKETQSIKKMIGWKNPWTKCKLFENPWSKTWRSESWWGSSTCLTESGACFLRSWRTASTLESSLLCWSLCCRWWSFFPISREISDKWWWDQINELVPRKHTLYYTSLQIHATIKMFTQKKEREKERGKIKVLKLEKLIQRWIKESEAEEEIYIAKRQLITPLQG